MKSSAIACLFLFSSPFYLVAGTAAGSKVVNNTYAPADSISSETEATVNPRAILFPDNPDNNAVAKGKPYDIKKEGLFKALFHVGLNISQIDGDAYAGYTTFGFDGGAGVLIRFHKYMSVSAEINYAQWGSRASLVQRDSNYYRVKANYIQVPIAFNVHDKDIIMFSAGLNLGYLVAFNERNEQGVNITDTVTPQPHKFDLDAFGELHVIIKKQFAIGVKYSYSIIPLRGVEDRYLEPYRLTKANYEHNNAITVRFMYILSAVKKKKE